MPEAEIIPRIICPKLNKDAPGADPSMYPSAIAFFNSFPFSAAQLSPANAIPFITQCLTSYDDRRDQLLGKVLYRPDALKHMLCVFHPEDDMHASDPCRSIDKVTSMYAFGPSVTGPKDAVHGGVIMTMLDEAMGSLFEINTVLGKTGHNFETMSVTGSIEVKFLRTVPLYEPVCATASVAAVDGRKTKLHVSLKDKDGHELAKCTSTWIALRPTKI